MTEQQWEDVEVPRGQYIGWGFHPGQAVTGKVLSFAVTGGTDAKGKPCPELGLELTEPCDSYRDRGTTRERVEAGELVTVTAGLVSLKRALTVAQPEPGDLIKLVFEQTVTVKTPEGPGEVKEFKVRIARGAGRGNRPAARPAEANPYASTAATNGAAQSEPPF